MRSVAHIKVLTIELLETQVLVKALKKIQLHKKALDHIKDKASRKKTTENSGSHKSFKTKRKIQINQRRL